MWEAPHPLSNGRWKISKRLHGNVITSFSLDCSSCILTIAAVPHVMVHQNTVHTGIEYICTCCIILPPS